MPEYPEHDKMAAVTDRSQVIGAFLDWLLNERKPPVALATPSEAQWDYAGHDVVNISIEKLLAEYFSIDLDRIAAEKDAMLETIRNTKEDRPCTQP